MKKEDERKPFSAMKAVPNDTEKEKQFNANVTHDERELLEQTEESSGSADDLQLQQAKLDNTDEDGEPLNESNDQSGEDLDVPGEDEDDSDEDDEENNSYSLNDDKEDDVNTRQ